MTKTEVNSLSPGDIVSFAGIQKRVEENNGRTVSLIHNRCYLHVSEHDELWDIATQQPDCEFLRLLGQVRTALNSAVSLLDELDIK